MVNINCTFANFRHVDAYKRKYAEQVSCSIKKFVC